MSERLPGTLVAYRGLATVLAPLAPAYLRRRVARGKEHAARLAERRGYATVDRPAGPLVWAHGASIGESLSLLPLVDALVGRGTPVLVTSGTVTSADILAKRLPAGARHQFVPLDSPPFWRRFLQFWQPHLALFAESEIWPGAVTELARQGVPLALVNAKLSERSSTGWSRVPKTTRAVFSRVALCLAQSDADASRFARLGAPAVHKVGNLKFDIAPPPADPAAVESLSAAFAHRPVWLAASTHEGEEDAAIEAHLGARTRVPNLLTVIAPRHPERARDVVDLAAMSGLSLQRHSEDLPLSSTVEIYLVDTVGDLGLFFRAVPLAFMGASLAPGGGHNPIEPARLGAAILHGPSVSNHAEIFAALDRSGGALQVMDAAALADTLPELLGDPAGLRGMARAASVTVEEFGGALGRTMAALAPLLPPPAEGGVPIW